LRRRGNLLGRTLLQAVLVSKERTFTLSQEDEIALLEAIQEAERGELLDGRELLDACAHYWVVETMP
jgi:hypothetical protein